MTDDERQDDDGRGVVVPFNPRRRHASKPKPDRDAAFEFLHATLIDALGRHDDELLAAAAGADDTA